MTPRGAVPGGVGDLDDGDDGRLPSTSPAVDGRSSKVGDVSKVTPGVGAPRGPGLTGGRSVGGVHSQT